MKKLWICVLCTLFFLSGCQNIQTKNEETIKKLDVSNVENLMIVAHPDDETIWGGYHLQQNKYLVLCLTNKDNKVRNKEFTEAIQKTGNIGLILDYPDKTNGKRDTWDTSKDKIYQDICTIINKKNFKTIVTHNPDGEYGHIHHKMTSQLVTKAVKDKSKLFYFGHYYKKDSVNKEKKYSSKSLISKDLLVRSYTSQKKGAFSETKFADR